jgi:hypothetical protein
VITVRIAHAEPRAGRQVSGEQIDDPRVAALQDRGIFLRGFLVVLADDTGHRALPIWLAEDPWVTPLPALLDRPGDDTWAMAGVPETFAARLVSAGGARVSGVEIQAAGADLDEVSTETCVARVELSGPSGTGPVMARLDLGLTLAAAADAPVWVADAVMDRLAVPVPGDDLLAPFRRPAAEMDQAGVIVDRRAGRVFHVPEVLTGTRPRFEPRNMTFSEGLDRWDLDSGLGEEAGSRPHDYSAAAEGQCAVLSSTSPEPRGSAVLVQAVFAEDFCGTTAVFGGDFRTEDVAGRAGLCLEIAEPDPRVHQDRDARRVVTVTDSPDWSRQQVTVPVPEDAEIIRFGILLAGPGRVWLRNPELRAAGPDDREPAAGG